MFNKQFDLFKHNKAFRNFTLSCILAMFGNGLTYVVMVWALIKFNPSVISTAILMTCFWLPNVLLGPIWGVFADRYNRKFLLLFTNLSRALCLFGFVILTQNHITAAALYCLATLLGSILAAYYPIAMTFVREIVAEEDLLYANATVDIAYEVGGVLGMGGAGLILASTSYATCFIINGLCYLLAGYLLVAVYYQKPLPQVIKSHSFIRQFIEGAQYIAQDRQLLLIYSVQGLFFVAYMIAPVLLAPYARSVLHSSVAQFGWLEAMLSTGLIVGGFLSPWFANYFRLSHIILSQVALGIIAFYLFSHTRSINWAIFYHLLIGFTFSSWALLTTLAQEMTEINYQGRVQSLFNGLSGTAIVGFYYVLAHWDNLPLTKLYFSEISLLFLAGALLLVMFFSYQEEGELGNE